MLDMSQTGAFDIEPAGRISSGDTPAWTFGGWLKSAASEAWHSGNFWTRSVDCTISVQLKAEDDTAVCFCMPDGL